MKSDLDYIAKSNIRILIADGDPMITRLIDRMMVREGYNCDSVHEPDTAYDVIDHSDYDVVFLEMQIARKWLKGRLVELQGKHPEIAFIIMCGPTNMNQDVNALLAHNIHGYISKPFHQAELLIALKNALTRKQHEIFQKAWTLELRDEVQRKTSDIREREREITLRLMSAVEFRHFETGQHIRRLGEYSALIAGIIGWDDDDIDDIRLAATMHDIGKIGTPDTILFKPGRLTPEERKVMEQHCAIGKEILDGSTIPIIQMACDIAYCHHEKWDGSGYPQKLIGTTIPQSARIVAILDVWDALRSKRVYAPSFTFEKTLSIMAEMAPGHFDPTLYQVFLDNLDSIQEIYERFQDEPKPGPQ